MGQAPTSQARPRDTDHLRPSNLAAKTLSVVERTLFKVGGDPCPMRRGLLAGFSTMKVKPVLFSVFGNGNGGPKSTKRNKNPGVSSVDAGMVFQGCFPNITRGKKEEIRSPSDSISGDYLIRVEQMSGVVGSFRGFLLTSD